MPWLPQFFRPVRHGTLVLLALGFTVGAVFGSIARSLVHDVLMPPLVLLLGRGDVADLFWVLADGEKQAGPYLSLADAHAAGAITINYGIFVGNLIALLIVVLAAWAALRWFHRAEGRLEDALDGPPPAPDEPADKKCPHCLSVIAWRATRCPHCTSHLPAILPAGLSLPRGSI